MNIVFFTRYFHPHIGGVEKHVENLSNELIKMGHRITVITEQYENSTKQREKLQNINIYRTPTNENYFKKFQIWIWLIKNIHFIKNADVIHCHDVFFWYIPFRFIFPNKKAYVTFHGYETHFPINKKAIIVRRISNLLSSGSINIGKYIEKWYGTKADFIVWGGVKEIENLKLKVENVTKRNIEKLNILFIGRLEKDTGVSVYLNVLKLLKQKNIKFNFEVCGDGSLRKRLSKYGKVHGLVRNISKYIDKSDIVFASSYLSILEALQHKKLVVSVCDNELKKDYLTKTPFSKWIIIGSSSGMIVKDLIKYCNDPSQRIKPIDQAYRWVNQQTWYELSKTYLRLWKL